jgi:putative ABC transport system permease protein
MYVSYQQHPWVLKPEQLIVRTVPSIIASSVLRDVMREVHRLDKDLPATDIQTMDEVQFSWVSSAQMVMLLLMAFAGLALVLSAMGIYSVLSYSVAQRTREMGMRMALGAQPGHVLRLVVGGGARLALLGIVVGLVAALALTKLMTGLIYGVQPADPITFVSAVAVLGATTLVACFVPARRATKIDPIVALRHQ